MNDVDDTDIIHLQKLDGNETKKITRRWDDEAKLQAAAQDLQIISLSKLSLKITLKAQGKANWKLSGHVGASVTQACVITLEDVKERIDVPIDRLYLADFDRFEAQNRSETKLDETVEPLPQAVDLFALALEVVALNLTQFPKREGINLDALDLPINQPNSSLNPFAALEALKAPNQGEPKP